MKIEKHGNKFRISYHCPNYPEVIREVFDTKEEADLRAAVLELERKRGVLTPPPELVDPTYNRDLFRETVTIEMLMKEYVRMHGTKHWSPSTMSCNLHYINDYIIPYIGKLCLKDITTHRLETFYNDLLTVKAKPLKGREHEVKTIGVTVIEKIHTVIRSAFNQAIRWDYYRGGNPALPVELPKRRKKIRDVWEEEDARRALENCTDPALSLCLYLAIGCSMRIGEILGLTWDCVHITPEEIESHSAYVRVEKELHRAHTSSIELLRKHSRDSIMFTFPAYKKNMTTQLVLKTPKTESSVRNIYLPYAVTEQLLAARKAQEERKMDVGSLYQDFNLVVAQESGRPYEIHMIDQKLSKYIKEQGLPKVVFHSLRHCSTGLKLRLSGGDIKAVQGDTGHSQSNMVTDVYAHVMTDDRKRLALKMQEEFFASKSKKEGEPPEAFSPDVLQLLSVLNSSPEMTKKLLLMTEILGA